jgi:hypothetical protein
MDDERQTSAPPPDESTRDTGAPTPTRAFAPLPDLQINRRAIM